MAANGEAVFSLTKKLSKAVIMQCQHTEGTVYQFRMRKRKADGTEVWSCSDCESVKRRRQIALPIPCIELHGTRHSSDPQNPSYQHFCGEKSKEEATAKQVCYHDITAFVNSKQSTL